MLVKLLMFVLSIYCSLQICKLVAQGDGDASEVHFIDFIPGTVMAFKVSVKPKVAKAISVLRLVSLLCLLLLAEGFCSASGRLKQTKVTFEVYLRW